MWPFPLSALRKCTSYFENGVILVLLRIMTFFIILSSAFELLGFRLNVVDYQLLVFHLMSSLTDELDLRGSYADCGGMSWAIGIDSCHY